MSSYTRTLRFLVREEYIAYYGTKRKIERSDVVGMNEVLRILDVFEAELKERDRFYSQDLDRYRENALVTYGKLNAVKVLRHRLRQSEGQACSETKSRE